jgi:hypothetical protein
MFRPPLPESLADLYPRDTPLVEVHPEFRGMPFRMWYRLKFVELARESYAAAAKRGFFLARAAEPELADEPQASLFPEGTAE